MTAMTPDTRLCGACLPHGAEPVETGLGICGGCGLRTMLARDARPLRRARVPAGPRCVPPASGLRLWPRRARS